MRNVWEHSARAQGEQHDAVAARHAGGAPRDDNHELSPGVAMRSEVAAAHEPAAHEPARGAASLRMRGGEGRVHGFQGAYVAMRHSRASLSQVCRMSK